LWESDLREKLRRKHAEEAFGLEPATITALEGKKTGTNHGNRNGCTHRPENT